MGSVKVDIHKKDYEWKAVNFADPDSIKGLLKYRSKYDLLFQKNDIYLLNTSNADLDDLSEEVICLYNDLDKLIAKCDFNKKQKIILDYYMNGYNEKDISTEMNLAKQTVNGIINTMCKNIAEQNNESWKFDFLYWSEVKVKNNYKQCTKCKRWLPATEEYFSPKYDNKDKLDNRCKKCERIRKNN